MHSTSVAPANSRKRMPPGLTGICDVSCARTLAALPSAICSFCLASRCWRLCRACPACVAAAGDGAYRLQSGSLFYRNGMGTPNQARPLWFVSRRFYVSPYWVRARRSCGFRWQRYLPCPCCGRFRWLLPAMACRSGCPAPQNPQSASRSLAAGPQITRSQSASW